MLNRWMTKGMTGILAVAIIILIGVTQVYAEKSNIEDMVDTEAAQLEPLLKTADTIIHQVDQLVIKWQGEGKGNAKEQAVSLAEKLGLSQPQVVRQTGHDVYRSQTVIDTEKNATNIDILLNVVDTGNDRFYTIVQLSGGLNTDRKTLLTLHGQIKNLLHTGGVDASWNMSVQGRTVGTADSVDSDANHQLKKVEQRLSRELKVTEVERYTDVRTASVSYEAKDLPLSVKSGGHMLNMQLAVHQVGDLEANRITIGFPVITIEY